MTNFEKYKDEILKIATESKSGPAKKDGVIIACDGLPCRECDFGGVGKCNENRFGWLYEDDGENRDGCNGCKHEYKREDESPCTECCNNYTSKFEPKPRKTRQDELLELYPNIRKWNGVIDICPGDLDMYHYCKTQGPSGEGCIACIRDYWLQEVEE